MNTLNGLIPCIVSGGSGTRLWPVSRQNMPKPFMRMRDGQSLLQKTFLRASALKEVSRVLTVTNREVFFRTQDEYRQLNQAGVALDYESQSRYAVTVNVADSTVTMPRPPVTCRTSD